MSSAGRVEESTRPDSSQVMNKSGSRVPKLCTGMAAAVLVGALLVTSPAAETNSTGRAAAPKQLPKKAKRELTGAELYAIHCNRFHPERYAPERTDVQWKTILTHMRVRVNLPARQAQAILKFLQEDSGK